MKVTKYGHACLFVEEAGRKLVIDPGGLTELPVDLAGIAVVVVTHVHFDHLNLDNLKKIAISSPGLVLIADLEVMDEAKDLEVEKITITEDCVRGVGGFEIALKFGDHAVVYQKVPCYNLTVMVNDKLYYPGDSYLPNEIEVSAVAVPICAPWAKTSDSIEFAKQVKAKLLFPTHNGLLNEAGLSTFQNWLGGSVSEAGKQWQVLGLGESIEV